MPARFAAHIQQDSGPELAEKIERLLSLLGCDDRVSGAGSDCLGSAIIESKAVDRCGKLRSVRTIEEGERGRYEEARLEHHRCLKSSC